MSIHLADYIDILGTFSFSVSGAFAAKEKNWIFLVFSSCICHGYWWWYDTRPADRRPARELDARSEIGWVIAAGAAASLFSEAGCNK